MFWFYYQTDPCQCLVYLSGTFCILTCTSHHSSFCECWAFVFIVLFFFKKEKIVLMFSLFSCCWVGSFMKWSILVKCDIKHANKCVRVHLTTGGVFLFIHVFDIFNCRLFLLQFHHFFHFLCGFAVFLIVQCPPP